MIENAVAEFDSSKSPAAQIMRVCTACAEIVTSRSDSSPESPLCKPSSDRDARVSVASTQVGSYLVRVPLRFRAVACEWRRVRVH
jgi:hypothetical protein